MAEHGKRADCSRDPVAVKAAIKLVRRAGHKVNSQMLGSSQECMTTHEEMADCSQNIILNNNAELGEEEKVGRRTPVARRRRTPVARRRRTPSSQRRRTRLNKCSQPKLPPLECPPGFKPVANSFMNVDKTKKGVRLLARAVSCACTQLPSNINQVLTKAKQCKVTVYDKAHFKSFIRTFTTSSINGQEFKNDAGDYEGMAAELGEEEHVKVGSGSGQEYKQFLNERRLGSGEKAGLWRRRRRGPGPFAFIGGV